MREFVRKNRWRIFLAIAIIVAVTAVFHYFSSLIDMKALETHMRSFGNLMPLFLLLLIIITSTIGFIFPIPVAASALLMDYSSAFFISIIGLTIGAVFSFIVARYIGRDYVERKFVNRMRRLKHYDDNLRKRGFWTIVFFRLVSLIPFELINIVAGLSEIGIVRFTLGTIVGIIPGTLLTIYLVQSTKDVTSLNFLLSSITMTLFSLLPLLSRKVRLAIFGK